MLSIDGDDCDIEFPPRFDAISDIGCFLFHALRVDFQLGHLLMCLFLLLLLTDSTVSEPTALMFDKRVFFIILKILSVTALRGKPKSAESFLRGHVEFLLAFHGLPKTHWMTMIGVRLNMAIANAKNVYPLPIRLSASCTVPTAKAPIKNRTRLTAKVTDP